MNIPVLTYSGRVVMRPDTSREWKNGDLYLPDFVSRLSYSPVLTLSLSRAGKCVGGKFADRYYDAVGFGLLLYPQDFLSGGEEGYAEACCLDHTTYITPPDFPIDFAETSPSLEISVSKGGQSVREVFIPLAGTAVQAMTKITERLLIRRGDIAAVELAPRKCLMSREEGNVHVVGTAGGRTLIDFNIIVE